MIAEDEEELQHALADIYRNDPGVRHVETGQNLSHYGADDHMEQWYDRLGFRASELDLVIVRRNYDIEVVEVKYHRATSKNRPSGYFYSGISQAIALTRLGIDTISLQHFFHPDVRPVDVNEFGSTMLDLENWLDLPFDYRPYQLQKQEKFNPILVNPKITPKTSIHEKKQGINTISGRRNPILSQDVVPRQVRRNREFVRIALKIPSE